MPQYQSILPVITLKAVMDQSLSLTCINYILNVHKVGLNSTRFLIDRVRVLLLHEGSKETSSEQHEYKGY
jgi:hypothetical protein